MLILCYGITKSGSTLAFELVKGVLESAGHPQQRLPDGVVEKGSAKNYVGELDREKIRALMHSIGRDRKIAVKTHGGFRKDIYVWLERLQSEGKLQVIASYRDPRDICLSLLDAGAKSRASGKPAFAKIVDIPTAIAKVQKQLSKFRRWGSLRGALRLDYRVVAFDTDSAIDIIERKLNVSCDRTEAKKHAFEDAFTQKNKGRSGRFETELTAEQQAELTAPFETFIRDVCESGDDRWFSACRDRILAEASQIEVEAPH